MESLGVQIEEEEDQYITARPTDIEEGRVVKV